MTGLRYSVRAGLWLLILAGLWSGIRVSYTTLTGTAPCPDAAGFPICYAVTLGYLGMLGAQLPWLAHSSLWLFYPAWGLVTLIALVGTGAELIAGDVCPKSSRGTPLCFFSLAFCVSIALFYFADRRLGSRSAVAP